MNANTGTYTINAPGARTLADATPLVIEGKRVSAVVDADGTYNVFIGGGIVATGILTGTEGNVMAFFAQRALDFAPAVESVVDETAVTEALGTESVSDAVRTVRQSAEVKIALAIEDEKHGETDYRFRSALDGKLKRIPAGDPRHPTQRAASLRREAAVLAAWTDADEKAYNQYISDGLGDTDGYFAPESRYMWKRTA